MKKTLVIGIIALLFIPPVFAGMQSIVLDMSLESNPKAMKHGYFVHDLNPDSIAYATAEPWFGDGYTGKKCAHLHAKNGDGAELINFIKKKIELDDITEAGFYFKKLPGSDSLSPFLELDFYRETESGPDYFLTVIQLPGGHLGGEWNYHDDDRWYYIEAIGLGQYNIVGLPDGISLEEIQDEFDAYLGQVDVNVGGPLYPGMDIDVLVDHIVVK